MILPCSLLDAHKQLFVFVEQRQDERLVVAWQLWDEIFQGGLSGQLQFAEQMPQALLANGADRLQGFGLGVDGHNAGRDAHGLAMHDKILFLIKQGQHLAVLLEFFSQGFDEMVQRFIHDDG